jgi:hypothetical protein
MFTWATSGYEDRGVRFTLKERLDALPSPQKISYSNGCRTKSRCPFCGMIGASTRQIQCMCKLCGAKTLVTKQHDRAGCVVADGARARHKKRYLKINENQAINPVCQLHFTTTRKIKRPDLVDEATDKDTGKFTCPWPWADYDEETLEKSHRKTVGKYHQLRHGLEEADPGRKTEHATIVVDAPDVSHKR